VMPRLIICMECGEEKPLKARGMCGACYQTWWSRRNPAKAAATLKRYRVKNREKRAAKTRQWKADNPEKVAASRRQYYEENREREAINSRRWAQENPEAKAAKKSRRRARKKTLPDTLTAQEAARILAIGRAVYPNQELHLDHIVPISKGGGTTLGNVHFIPASLNFGKGNRLPQEIYKQEALF